MSELDEMVSSIKSLATPLQDLILREAMDDREYAEKAAAELATKDAELAALRERVKVLGDALLISGNNLADVKNFLETEIKVCNGVGMEYELGLVESIDAFQDLHGELVKELGEKHAALRGEA